MECFYFVSSIKNNLEFGRQFGGSKYCVNRFMDIE
jgi:hypothetical protein